MQSPSFSMSQNCCNPCKAEVILTIFQGIILAAAFFSRNMMYEKANNIYCKCRLMMQSITCFPQTFSIQTSMETGRTPSPKQHLTYYLLRF